MRASVSLATLRRLETMETPRVASRGGLLIVPKMLALDEWERAAQEWARRFTQLDPKDAPQVAPGKDPHDVSHRYRSTLR